MIDPAKYCIFMNNYSFIDNDGYVAMCCKNLKNKLSQYHISEHKLIDIWNSPEMNAVRDEMARGEEVAGCFKCYEPEKNGVRSFRQKTLGMINNNVPFDDHKIHALDLRLGNICNLACIMCFAGNSNLLYKHLPKMSDHFGWKDGTLEKEQHKYHARNYKWTEDEGAWDNIISSVDSTLRHVYLAGGEPFYLRNFPDTVRRLGTVAPNAKIVINTNGTRLLRDKDLQALSDINIRIRFSVDGWGLADEFTRQETNFEEKLVIMDQYHKHFKVGVWDITANAFTVRHIPQLVEYLHNRYPGTKIQMRPVVNKTEVLMENLPDYMKADSLKFFEENKAGVEGIEHVIHEMRKPHNADPDRKKKVKHFVDYWEKVGSVKIQDFDTELSDWLGADA